MPRRRWVGGAAVVALVGAIACTSVRVRSEALSPGDLARYRSYAWRSAPPAPQGWQPYGDFSSRDARIRADVDRGLAGKGYRLADRTSADFLVVYDVAIHERNTETFREWADYKARGGGSGLLGAWAEGYDEGTLLLVALDRGTGTLVWRGSASAVLSDDGASASLIDEAVSKMLRDFPPASGAR